MARTVTDGRYRYTRNFMPHRPYVQEAIIFSGIKESYRELRRVRQEGALPPEAEAMFTPKPAEALYDLQSDTHETTNLIDSPDHRAIRDTLRTQLFDWMREVRDTGLLHEAEMMIRAEGSTPYAMAHDAQQFDLPQILDAARRVGRPEVSLSTLRQRMDHPDSGVRYWTATALLARGDDAAPAADVLTEALDDPSPSVRLVAAEALCALDRCD